MGARRVNLRFMRFPDGLDAEVRPLGVSQIAATTVLRERLVKAVRRGER